MGNRITKYLTVRFTKIFDAFICLFGLKVKILFSALMIPFFSPILPQGGPVASQDISTPPPAQNAGVKATPILEILPGRKSVGANKQADIKVNTQNFSITIQAKGGEIKEFLHLDAASSLRNNANLTDTNSFPFQVYSNKENLNLMRTSFFTISKSKVGKLHIVQAVLPVKLKTATKTINARFIKIFSFHETSHFWEFKWKIEHNHNTPLDLSGYYFYPVISLGPAGDEKSPRSAQTNYNFQYVGEDFEQFFIGSGGSFFGCGGSSENQYTVGKVRFFGRSSRFMTAAFMPLFNTKGIYFLPEIPTADEKKPIPQQMHIQLNPIVTKDKLAELSFAVFTGPKEKNYLVLNESIDESFPWRKKVDPDLYKAFDFGFTAPIRDLIVSFLNALYKIIPNYGVGIIIFALLFKLIFFPLNQKQAESMKKMSALQPLLKEINEKYKENPQEKQRRTLALYSEHKVNPMGGCLPMLIQIPIFIALYSAFSDSYELWKSPFIPGWIPDLSEPDVVFLIPESWPVLSGFALHALPLLMTITQFFQTKMTMVSGDDNQKRIMQFMPLIMLFFFWSMPAGVVLYWTIQNILSVGQQIYTNNKEKEA